MKKILYRILGIVCVVLGAIGIVLPLLPTTPFLLLAAWAFLRSSEELYDWLINHRVFGYYIKAYLKYKGVEKRHKILAISMLWITMSISIYIVDPLWVKGLLVAIGIGVTIHLLSLRTLTKEEIENLKNMEENRINKQVSSTAS